MAGVKGSTDHIIQVAPCTRWLQTVFSWVERRFPLQTLPTSQEDTRVVAEPCHHTILVLCGSVHICAHLYINKTQGTSLLWLKHSNLEIMPIFICLNKKTQFYPEALGLKSCLTELPAPWQCLSQMQQSDTHSRVQSTPTTELLNGSDYPHK